MLIQLNTDKNIPENERLIAYVNTTIADELSRFSDHITRIEVHFSDENASKPGQNDKRCMMEARIENRQPIAVTCHANSVEQAMMEALEKLKASLETRLGQLKNH